MHSGRQLGGVPMKPVRHAHDGDPLISLHSELGPQGDGSQGFSNVGIGTSEIK